MAYNIRPLEALADLARQAFVAAVPGAIVRLWANTFTVFGKVFALLDFEHEQRRAYLYAQIFASTAAEPWLARHGFELSLTQDPGNVAIGTMTTVVPGGTIIPSGISYRRADGRTYSVLAPVSAVGGTGANVAVDLPISADLAGAGGNMQAGDILTLVNPAGAPFGLATSGSVDTAGLTGGTDPEDIETFRARVLYRKRNPPQGGSDADYVKWVGEALSTVRGVYVDSFANDSRAVWVCFTVSDRPAGIPSAGEVATVQAYVNDPVRRPVTARVFVTAPTPVPISIGITHFHPDTPDVRAAVTAELVAFFTDDVSPATPSSALTLYVEHVSAAIARAAGVGDFTLAAPAADQVLAAGGQMPVLGNIGYS